MWGSLRLAPIILYFLILLKFLLFSIINSKTKITFAKNIKEKRNQFGEITHVRARGGNAPPYVTRVDVIRHVTHYSVRNNLQKLIMVLEDPLCQITQMVTFLPLELF